MIRSALDKLLPLSLLAVFLYTVFGYYAVTELNRTIVRKQVAASLKENSCTIISLVIQDAEHDPGFRRLNSKEIEYLGKMYDVVKETRQGTATVFSCFHDTKEEKLVAGLKRAASSKLTLALAQYLMINALLPGCSLPAPAMVSGITYGERRSMIPEYPSSPASPPPKA